MRQHVASPAELNEALAVLSKFDEGPDLVLYYKYLLVLLGETDYEHHFNESDRLSESQRRFAEEQLRLFRTWWANWEGSRVEVADSAIR